MSRTVEDIFQRMKQRAAERQATAPAPSTEVCLCGGQLYYVKATHQGRQFEVCPRCNPRLACTHCDGTGHLRHHDPDTGEESLEPYGCDCVITEQRVALLNAANIPEKYMPAKFSFDTMQQSRDFDGADLVAKYIKNQHAVIQFCNQVPAIVEKGPGPGDQYFLTLVGPVGTGKTHMAVCALRNLIWAHGLTGRFIDFQSLLQEIKDSYSKREKALATEEDLKRPLREVEVLVIDELGKGRIESEWELEKLDDLINSRYNNGRITILTTNYLPPELQEESQKSNPQPKRNSIPTPDAWRPFHDQAIGGKGDLDGVHATESYRTYTLPERIGERMYDRILEASLIIDFIGISSFRKKFAADFAKRLGKS